MKLKFETKKFAIFPRLEITKSGISSSQIEEVSMSIDTWLNSFKKAIRVEGYINSGDYLYITVSYNE